jgi:hypothetical protein
MTLFMKIVNLDIFEMIISTNEPKKELGFLDFVRSSNCRHYLAAQISHQD